MPSASTYHSSLTCISAWKPCEKGKCVTQTCNPRAPPARREEETREWAEHVCSTAVEATRHILPREQDESNKCAKPDEEKPIRPKSFTKDYRQLRKPGVGEAALPGKSTPVTNGQRWKQTYIQVTLYGFNGLHLRRYM